MSKLQMWIVATAVAVVALIVGIRYLGGSATEHEAVLSQRLAQRAAQTEHSGWTARSRSEDLPGGEDVKVQRQVEAKPGSIAPPRRDQPAAARQNQPAAAVGTDPAVGSDAVAQPGSPGGAGARRGDTGVGAAGTTPDAIDTTGDVIHAPSAPQAVPGSLAANPPGGQAAPPGQDAATGTSAGGSDGNTASGDQLPPTTLDPADDLRIGAIYDSKDATFSIGSPVEVDDIGTIPGPGVAMMMQLEPDWEPDNQDDSTFLKLGDNLELSKNVNFLRLEYVDSAGNPQSIGSDMRNWPGRGIEPPYNVAALVNGNKLWLIVNGVQVAQGIVPGAPYENQPNPGLKIGCVDYPPSRPCAGGNGSRVVVVPSISPAEAIARTKPPPAE